MYKSLHRQAGLTGISIAVILALIAFFTLLLLKIGPIYLDNFKIKESLASLEKEESLPSQPIRKIKQLLMKRLDINMVETVSAKDIVVTKQEGKVTVQVSYEVTENIFGNLDVLVYFDDEIEVRKN